MSHPKLNDLKPKLSFIIFCSQICNFSKTQRGQHITALQGDSTSGMKTERNLVPGGWTNHVKTHLFTYLEVVFGWRLLSHQRRLCITCCTCPAHGAWLPHIAEQLASQSKHPKRMWKLQVIKVYSKNWHCWQVGICCLLSKSRTWIPCLPHLWIEVAKENTRQSRLRRERVCSSSGCLSPTCLWVPPEPCAGQLAWHTSLLGAEAEGSPIPYLQGADIAVVDQVLFKPNKGIHMESEQGQIFHTSWKVSPGHEEGGVWWGGILVPRPIFMWVSKGQKTEGVCFLLLNATLCLLP